MASDEQLDVVSDQRGEQTARLKLDEHCSGNNVAGMTNVGRLGEADADCEPDAQVA